MTIEKWNTLTTTLSSLSTMTNDTNIAVTVDGLTMYSPSILELILSIAEKIIALPMNQLHPNPFTNSLFTSLVNVICLEGLKEEEIAQVLSHNSIMHLQQSLMEQCSSAEYFLEASFARELQSGKKSIEDFIYYNNYESLVQFEMDNLKMYTKNISITQVAIIGAGPLPLTSVEILKHLPSTVKVTNYDHSQEAVELAKVVVKHEERIFVKNRTALQISEEDLNEVNLVYLAALVGTDKVEKKKILEHLYNVMKTGSILIARSAVGLKTLVYRRLTTEEFGMFTDIKEFHPKDKKVLNSIMCGTR